MPCKFELNHKIFDTLYTFNKTLPVGSTYVDVIKYVCEWIIDVNKWTKENNHKDIKYKKNLKHIKNMVE